MEPVSVGVVVAAFLAKVLDRAGDEAAGGALDVARKALVALRERFSRENDAEAQESLECLIETPDSKRRQDELACLLEDRAAHSEELRRELMEILERAEGAGVRVGDITQTAEGDGNMQIACIEESEINIRQGDTPPRP